MKVAVIGAGVMGLATGWALKRRGHEPVVYEQFEVGNPHGSSHGRSRIFRLAYAEDHYVRLAQESLSALARARGRDRRDGARAARPGRDRADARGEHRPHARALRRRLGAARPRGGRATLPDQGRRRDRSWSSSPRPGSPAPTRRSPRSARELDVREGERVAPGRARRGRGRRDGRLLGQRAARRAAAGQDDARDALLLPAGRRRPAGSVGRLVQARPRTRTTCTRSTTRSTG